VSDILLYQTILYAARNASLFSAHCEGIALNCVTWFRNPKVLLQCVWPAKSSWPMSKIVAHVSIVSEMKIPGPMLDQPVYRCGRWLVQNAYIAGSEADPVMPQHCGLMWRVQVNRPVTRKWCLLELSFQLTQNSTRTSQFILQSYKHSWRYARHCSMQGCEGSVCTMCRWQGSITLRPLIPHRKSLSYLFYGRWWWI